MFLIIGTTMNAASSLISIQCWNFKAIYGGLEPRRNQDVAPAGPPLAGRYDNPIPTRFLAPIDRSKISAQYN